MKWTGIFFLLLISFSVIVTTGCDYFFKPAGNQTTNSSYNSKDNFTMYYGMDWDKKVYSDGHGSITYYSVPIYSDTNGRLINETESLLDSEFSPFGIDIEFDGVHKVEVLDYNSTSIKLNISLIGSEKEIVPVKLFAYSKSVVESPKEITNAELDSISELAPQKIELSNKTKYADLTKFKNIESWYELKPDQELHIGENSTTVKYNYSDSVNNKAYFFITSGSTSSYYTPKPSSYIGTEFESYSEITTDDTSYFDKQVSIGASKYGIVQFFFRFNLTQDVDVINNMTLTYIGYVYYGDGTIGGLGLLYNHTGDQQIFSISESVGTDTYIMTNASRYLNNSMLYLTTYVRLYSSSSLVSIYNYADFVQLVVNFESDAPTPDTQLNFTNSSITLEEYYPYDIDSVCVNAFGQNSSDSIYKVCNNGTANGTSIKMWVNETVTGWTLGYSNTSSCSNAVNMTTNASIVYSGTISPGSCVDIWGFMNLNNPTIPYYFKTSANLTS